MSNEWDVVIVGGGTAGLSAAQMLGRSLRRTLVIDGGGPRNRFAAHLHGVLGHDGADPADLLAAGRDEAARYGVEVERGAVARLVDEGDRLRVRREDSREDLARVVVLASGVRDALPAVAGLAEEWGRGVLHCPYCHGREVAGRRLAVLATGPASLHQAELVRQLSPDLTVFSAAVDPLSEDAAVRLAAREVRLVPQRVRSLRRRDDHLVLETEDGVHHAVDAVFTGGTPIVEAGFVEALALARTDAPGRPIAVDPAGRTSHPRVLAAGDLVGGFGNIPSAMASGAAAGAAANALLAGEDGDRAVTARAARRGEAWEQHYAGRDRVWSGAVNATVADVVQHLEPGSALDVGAGEGGDAVWLAEHGWRVAAVDVSPTAVQRAADLARDRGVEVDLRVGDGPTSVDGRFDLVLASFLHSWEHDFPRLRILREAARRVGPGGRLLVVSHAAPPPWSEAAHHDHPTLRAPEDELAALGLRSEGWIAEIVETRARRAPGPDGRPADLVDGVLLLRRPDTSAGPMTKGSDGFRPLH